MSLDLLAAVEPTPERPLMVLTGAGFSVASGIPTFRGEDGYWTVGSRVYRPMELATHAAFTEQPREVWRWYLYRKAICNQADPNASHHALAALEERLGDAFWLVTQNVDGLHRRAGTSDARSCEVHGNIDYMRDVGTGERFAIPDELARPDKEAPLTDGGWARLVNPNTGARCRPHVLWFDEFYEERLFRSDTAMGVASSCSALIVVGSSGAAALPVHATAAAARAGAVIVDINPGDNPFRTFCEDYERGVVLDTDALDGVERVCQLW